MNIVIPLGGIGKRFKDDGYLSPKPLIRFLGKPMIFWILDQIDPQKDDTIYIVYHHDLKKYNFKEIIKDNYSKKPNYDIRFVELFYQTEGAVETLLLTMKNIDNLERRIVSLDCDTFYLKNVVSIYRDLEESANCVFYFEDNQDKPIYSYIKMNDDGVIVEIKEKEKISTHANTGCYCFENGVILLDFCEKLISHHQELRTNMEYYVSSVIKLMLQNGYKFIGSQLEVNDFVCLGTPHLLKINSQKEQLKKLVIGGEDGGKKKQPKQKKRFCFDLDFTLVKVTTDPADYSKVEPIWKNINMLNYLKDQGHTIIIFTARRMRTHGGNQGKILKDIGMITFETLEKFGIQYDEIYFGKPYADYYIDDLAINSYYELEKELGYYSLFVPERSTNNLQIMEHTVIKKSEANNLDGEIYWYQNIPSELTHLFPKLIKSESSHSYEVEKIEGITLSHFYLNENLTWPLFQNFLEQLETIHNACEDTSCVGAGVGVDIYQNYVAKIKQRYQSYDYSRFHESDLVYQRLLDYFEQYQAENRGEICIIHGDPVFTNILITKLMDFKFIDMRGKQLDTLTLLGDKWYDYAKIYQSLLGYDEILLDNKVNQDYRKELMSFYEMYLTNKFNKQTLQDIKWITASLLFTLIPIHHNDKCHEYYKLIPSLINNT